MENFKVHGTFPPAPREIPTWGLGASVQNNSTNWFKILHF